MIDNYHIIIPRTRVLSRIIPDNIRNLCIIWNDSAQSYVGRVVVKSDSLKIRRKK